MFRHPLSKEAAHASPLPSPERSIVEVARSYDLDAPVRGIDVTWMTEAECRPGTWDDLDPLQQKAVCAGCPVVGECLEYAAQIGASESVYGGRWMWRGRAYPLDSDFPKELSRNARQMERAR